MVNRLFIFVTNLLRSFTGKSSSTKAIFARLPAPVNRYAGCCTSATTVACAASAAASQAAEAAPEAAVAAPAAAVPAPAQQ